MNKAKLKTYAPQARKDFIAAVTARANQLGLSEKNGKLEAAPAEKSGDVVIIAGQPWPAKVQGQRDKLIKRIQKDGFHQTMEAVAYGSKIGGYPGFAQQDPRKFTHCHPVIKWDPTGWEDRTDEFEFILLLQLDGNLNWGDFGLANFFIRKVDLVNRDFSKVLYDWSCF
ncbi:MAG: hypothetical protein A2V79_00125 [Betaproteobacteria bacterium RBG_16_56_24]|nr:MAG: hypothetical protein A2V79_00125 [Betaproteobacteria bacterium RBG_16_56_24]